MSKTFTYLVVISTLVLGLSLFGIVQGNSYRLFQAIGLTADSGALGGTGFSQSGFFDAVFGSISGILAVVATVGDIAVGYITNRDVQSALRAGFALGFGAWIIADLWALFTDVGTLFDASFTWAVTIIRVFIALMAIGLIYSIVQFGSGGDE